MRLRLILTATFAILVGCKTEIPAPSPAQIDEVEKRSGTFLGTLKSEDRKSYDDLKADWMKQGHADPAAMKKIYSQAVLQSQTILGRMGYGTLFTGTVDARTQEALLRYQKAKGISPSGNVDPLTYFALDEDEKVLDDRLVTPASFSFFAKRWNEYFGADGAWDYRNQENGWIVSSHIECTKSEGYCTEADAWEATIFGLTSVQVSTTIFQITKWNDYEIDAQDVEPCEKDQMVAMRDDKSVTMHMTSNQPDSISCSKLMGDAPPIDAHLRDGLEVEKPHREAVQKRRASLYQFSDTARKLIDPSK